MLFHIRLCMTVDDKNMGYLYFGYGVANELLNHCETLHKSVNGAEMANII